MLLVAVLIIRGNFLFSAASNHQTRNTVAAENDGGAAKLTKFT